MARGSLYDQPFTHDGPINSPIGTGAVYLSDAVPSDPVLAQIRNNGASIQSQSWSRWKNNAATSTPTARFIYQGGGGTGETSVPADFTIPCPDPLRWTVDSDSPVSIVQPDGIHWYAFFGLSQIGSNPRVFGHYRAEQWPSPQKPLYGLDGPGVMFPWVNGQTNTLAAAGSISIVAGLLTGWDIAQPEIMHTIAGAMWQSRMKYSGPGGTGKVANGRMPPATTSDGFAPTGYTGSSDYFGIGTLFAIKPNVNITAFAAVNSPGWKVLKCLQEFGLVVTDNANVGGFRMYGNYDVPDSWNAQVNTALSAAKAHFNVVINWQKLADTNDIRVMQTPKGGGTPLRAYIDPIGGTAQANGVFFGGFAATSFVVNTDEQITAVAPALAAGNYRIKIVTPAGESPDTLADDYVALNAPTITSITPSSGDDVGGTLVTIMGTDFRYPVTGAGAVSAVSFGAGAATSIAVISNTELQCVVPAGTAGAVDVAVTTPGGTATIVAAADPYTYTATSQAPTITSISPSSGNLVGGFQVIVFGTDFTGITAVNVDAVPVTHVVDSTTRITIPSMPAHAGGAINIQVVNGFGNDTASFTYAAPAPSSQSLRFTGTFAAGGLASETRVNFGFFFLDWVIAEDDAREFVDAVDFDSTVQLALIASVVSDKPLLEHGFINVVVPALQEEPGRVERIDAKRIRMNISSLGYDLANGTVETLAMITPAAALKV